MPVSEIKLEHVSTTLAQLTSQGKVAMAERCRTIIRAVLGFALGREWATRNVARQKRCALPRRIYTLVRQEDRHGLRGFLYMIGRRSCMISTMMVIRVTAMKIDWMKWLGRGTQIGFVVAAIAGYYGCQP
jgi:hypothetical protein